MQQNQLIHFPISLGSYNDFVNHILTIAGNQTSSYICIANVHMFIEAYQDNFFLEIVKQADVVTPDGLPLTWALSLFNRIKQDRVAGMDQVIAMPRGYHDLLQDIFSY